jgi:hypothetical protein
VIKKFIRFAEITTTNNIQTTGADRFLLAGKRRTEAMTIIIKVDV